VTAIVAVSTDQRLQLNGLDAWCAILARGTATRWDGRIVVTTQMLTVRVPLAVWKRGRRKLVVDAGRHDPPRPSAC
jgi:hypothetical protein